MLGVNFARNDEILGVDFARNDGDNPCVATTIVAGLGWILHETIGFYRWFLHETTRLGGGFLSEQFLAFWDIYWRRRGFSGERFLDF